MMYKASINKRIPHQHQPPPTIDETNIEGGGDGISKEDKQLITLLLLGLLVASCHPCLSQQIALQLHISVGAVWNIMMSIILSVVALLIMFVRKDNKSRRRGGFINTKQHIS